MSPLRIDAMRNREQLLLAAASEMQKHGASCSLEAIARRAGVGIATLYRRFPSREQLINEVTADSFRRLVDEARAARAEEPTGWCALERYLRRLVGLRSSILLPLAGGPRPDSEATVAEWVKPLSIEVRGMLRHAQQEGQVRPELEESDLVMLLSMLLRPPLLPVADHDPLIDQQPERQLQVVLDGIRAPGYRTLPGSALRSLISAEGCR